MRHLLSDQTVEGSPTNTIKSRKSNYRTLYIQNARANGALCSLPPANEVWGKVICLQACVCLQGGVPGPRVCLPPGGCLLRGGVPGGDPPGRPLLRAVRILLECILVSLFICLLMFV